MPNPTVAASPRLTREELKVLIANTWAVIVEDNNEGVLDTLMNMSAPVVSIEEGTYPDESMGLNLALGLRNEDGTEEELYLFSERELLEATVDKLGRCLEMEEGIRLSFLFPLQLRKGI